MLRCSPIVAAAKAKLPNPGSSLLNPRSYRAKVRRAVAMGTAQQAQLEQQALFAELGGPGATAAPSPSPKSRRQRRGHHVRRVVGREVAERAKSMTDAEWESVPVADKHAFTKFMAELLRERPTEATEQQRRRYFETTMVDPRDLDPNATVQDAYERLKMGLPMQIKNPQRTLGVSQAAFDAGDASLFDPDKVDALEEAMTQIKQVFTDYVRQRREGVSTETARRKLANMLTDLNVETQRHLSHMFRYAESRVRTAAREERTRQLRELQRLRRLVASRPPRSGPASTDPAPAPPSVSTSVESAESSAAAAASGDASTAGGDAPLLPATAPTPAALARTKKRAALRRSLGRALGLEVEVVESLITELEAQEQFMQFCEVFARLTVGRGFRHTAGDETLDAYTESLRRLYSVDAQQLGTLDVVQYLAAKEEAHPVEWARRWYERLVRIPLERTPEYQRLEAIQKEDRAALELQARASSGESEGAAAARAAAGHEAAKEAERAAAAGRTQQAVRLVEKMFMRPDDPRLRSLQEKRLRYVAYLQMERQIARARENARIFAGVEATAEAEECRGLYAQLMDRKAAVLAANDDAGRRSADGRADGAGALPACDVNVFARDPAAAALFERISEVTQSVMRRYTREARQHSRAAAKAEALARVLQRVGIAQAAGDSADAGAAAGAGAAGRAAELERLLAEKKDAVARRLLGVLEADVKSDLAWLDAMEEAERPPLLPVPEGMSYVSAADVQAWREVREADGAVAADPFRKDKKRFQPKLFGQPWQLPDKPLLFWGTGTRAVQQALEHAADDAERRRRGEPLAPPYPCPENPWGWRLVKDILDD